MSNYVSISLDEMKRELVNWQVNVPAPFGGTREYVFEKQIDNKPITIRVFSSVHFDTEYARKVGQDSIRVCAFNHVKNRGLVKSLRVYRTSGWEDRLHKKIKEVEDIAITRVNEAEEKQIDLGDFSQIMEMFAFAQGSIYKQLLQVTGELGMEKKLKSPRLVFNVDDTNTYCVQIASKQSKYPDTIAISRWDPSQPRNPYFLGLPRQFIGRIGTDAKFSPSKYFDEHAKAFLEKLSTDPKGYAAECGKKSGRCCFCSHRLKTDESLDMGYGPICARRWKLPWGNSDNGSNENN